MDWVRFWISIVLLSTANNLHSAAEHQHGVGHLHLVTEGNQLQLQLTLAADDLAEQGKGEVVQERAQRLLMAPPLVIPGDYACQLISTEINSPNHDKSHRGHLDVEATYHWQCQRPVKRLTVSLFKQLPQLQLLKAEIISPQQQSAQLLRPDTPELEWR